MVRLEFPIRLECRGRGEADIVGHLDFEQLERLREVFLIDLKVYQYLEHCTGRCPRQIDHRSPRRVPAPPREDAATSGQIRKSADSPKDQKA
ncbi:hypothetical protein D3C87_1864330 [compost metagenome]